MIAGYQGAPVTAQQIAQDVRALGVGSGDVLFVHASLRRVAGPGGMVVGGAIAVVEGLQEVLSDGGTLVFPAFSADYSEPALWTSPPVPDLWWPTIRELLPAYRPDRTPTFRIGLVPEMFRKMDGVLRSAHPQSSFCAWGGRAEEIVRDQPLERGLGEEGPLGRMHALDARVLLLGTGWDTCTSFHLAEDRMRPPPPVIPQGAPLLVDGRREWVRFYDYDYTSGDFDALGASWEAEGQVRRGTVGHAPSRLFRMRPAVDFAVGWLEGNR